MIAQIKHYDVAPTYEVDVYANNQIVVVSFMVTESYFIDRNPCSIQALCSLEPETEGVKEVVNEMMLYL